MMKRRIDISFLIAALTLTVPCAFAAGPVVVPVDGEPFEAELAAVDADWEFTFQTGEKRRTLSAADLVCWGSWAEAARGPIVVTADAGLLVADVFEADKESLGVDSLLFGTLKLPLDSLSGVVFDPPAGRHERDLLFDRVARATGNSDRIVLHNGDEITGTVDGLADDTVKLQSDVGPIEIDAARIAALIFNPSLKRPSPQEGLRCWASLSDGSLLLAAGLVLDDKSLKLTGPDSETWTTSPGELVAIGPLGGRATYLSDLSAAGYRHVPYLSLKWPYHRDRNVAGGRLRCDGRLYLKGLGLHSAGRITYMLDERYDRFQAELGIDDSTGGRGSVRARVYVDGRQKYTGATVRGGAAPVPIAVEVGGAKRLDLIVDFADRADQLDHADLLNARLIEE